MIDSSTTILLVEDSDEDYYAAMRAFEKSRLANPIVRCTNGEEALDYLFHRGKFSGSSAPVRPDLILLDLNLPGIDGREVLQEIKQSEDVKGIPVIVLTTSSAEKDVFDCYNAGANSYMEKPLDFQGLIDALKRLADFWFEVAILPPKR